MRKIFIILLLTFGLKATAQTPQTIYGDFIYPGNIYFNGGLYVPVKDTLNNPRKRVGAQTIRPQDTVGHPVFVPIYTWNGAGWAISSFNGSLYYTKSQLQTAGQAQVHWGNITNIPDSITTQVDTVSTVDQLATYTGASVVLFVTDPYRGGLFVNKGTGITDNILIFSGWHRVYNAEDGVLIDWAGADPTGVENSSPAIAAVIAKYNHCSLRAGATYLLEDSVTIQGKTNFVLDGKGATIKEAESFYSTIVVKQCDGSVIKDLRFDGPEDYAYFLTSDPSSPKQYLYVDSSNIVSVTGLFGQNKRGLITFSSCSNVNLDDWVQEGIFKNGIASNVLGAFGVRTVGYGFVDPTHYLVFGSITKGRVRNAGCPILIGDNTTYISISNNTIDSSYNNGIYISSALWATVTGNTMRKVGGTGIKGRGLGFTIIGNVITNSDLGISVSGNNIEAFYATIPTKYGTNGYSELVANNVIDTVSTRGLDVDFQDGGATHNTTIANNIVQYNASLTDYLLKVNTAGGTQIMGNKLQYSNATIAAYFQRATGDSTQTNIIANNIFRDCAGQALHVQGLKRSLVTGNVFDSLGASALVFDNSTGNKITDNIYKAGTVVHAISANGNNDNYIEGNTGNITADNLTSILLNNYPNVQQNISGTPRLLGQTAISGANIYVANGTTSSANWTQLTPASRTISTTSPLAGGGALTGNLTLSIANAAANGTTKGAATFRAADFNDDGAGLISLDTVNGPSYTKTQALSTFIQNQNAAAQSANFWITGNGVINNTLRVATSSISAAPLQVGTLPSYANLSAIFDGNIQTVPAVSDNHAVTFGQAKDSLNARWSVNGNTVSSGQFLGSNNSANVVIKANNDTAVLINTGKQVFVDSTLTIGDYTYNRKPIPNDPPHVFEVTSEGTTSYLAQFTNYSNSTGLANLHVRKARGTKNAPSGVLYGDLISSWGFRGYGTNNFGPSSGAFIVYARNNFTDSVHGTEIQIQTTAVGANAWHGRTYAFVFGADGSLTIPRSVSTVGDNNVITARALTSYANSWIQFENADSTRRGYMGMFGNTDQLIINADAGSTGTPTVRVTNRMLVNTATDNGSSLMVGGSVSFPIRTVTGSTTVAATDYMLLANNISNIVLTLPAASTCAGRIYVIKKIINNANTVTIQGNGAELIDASNTQVLSTQWASYTIQSNGTQWYIQ
ncbi:hypothetical protein F0L74_09715 [Chitinophaga agrisoli]|uniref:Uncharacterized protein n=1 Tax=Chitinophaga agrisoli TaxID=2607653 RepID=A0A5B2VUP6_9BACT|nr:right-handed parallel beta-helix repeat-containing protein [Chitinophaga agrisoli]KAA2242795.1 hypothetical protein F0L74_09715 [Chitinophaga agrisoli]